MYLPHNVCSSALHFAARRAQVQLVGILHSKLFIIKKNDMVVFVHVCVQHCAFCSRACAVSGQAFYKVNLIFLCIYVFVQNYRVHDPEGALKRQTCLCLCLCLCLCACVYGYVSSYSFGYPRVLPKEINIALLEIYLSDKQPCQKKLCMHVKIQIHVQKIK